MAQTSNEATLRAALHTAMQAAWTTLTKILDDPEYDTLPKIATDAPYGVIDLAEDISPESAGLKFDRQDYVYGLVGVFARPASGTIKAAQTTQINLLLAQLTANNHLHSIVRDQKFGISYANLFSAVEPVFSVSILATLTVIESKI